MKEAAAEKALETYETLVPFPFGSWDIPIESFKIQPIRLQSGAVYEGYYNDKYHKHGYGILIEPSGMI